MEAANPLSNENSLQFRRLNAIVFWTECLDEKFASLAVDLVRGFMKAKPERRSAFADGMIDIVDLWIDIVYLLARDPREEWSDERPETCPPDSDELASCIEIVWQLEPRDHTHVVLADFFPLRGTGAVKGWSTSMNCSPAWPGI